MLFFFRRLYCEVVTAIPVNGGCYNLLLNIGSKKVASYVACLSYLSYTATAVLSAFDAVVYLAEIWTGAGKCSISLSGFLSIHLVMFRCQIVYLANFTALCNYYYLWDQGIFCGHSHLVSPAHDYLVFVDHMGFCIWLQ